MCVHVYTCERACVRAQVENMVPEKGSVHACNGVVYVSEPSQAQIDR
jgi:hypothetical protein